MEARSAPDGETVQSSSLLAAGPRRSADDSGNSNRSGWEGIVKAGAADSAMLPPLTRATARPALLTGSKFPVMYLIALPAAVVAVASVGAAQYVSGLIAAAWFGLLPFTLYSRRAAAALPVVSAGLLVATLLALPFNSSAFVVDFWTTGAMFFLSLPRRSSAKLP
jgi:hypothetical protein